MRLALISDIHGNYVSLQAVLADIERRKVDEIVCLGDVATLGPQPGKVVETLRALGCPCVLGNHETFLFDIELGRAYMNADWFIDSVTWCHERLSKEDIDYLRTYQPMLKYKLAPDVSLLCFHGSPRSNVENIFSTTRSDVLDEILDGHKDTVMAGGHTHVQMMRQHNGMLIVNAGSVGMPFEQMPFKDTPRVLPWAEYTIISWEGGGLGVELRRVPIDMDVVMQAAIDSGMPENSDWEKNWITLGQFPQKHTGYTRVLHTIWKPRK
ncbi:MAG: metallophosphoesterase family protein [Chloroflexi bacterium]|nr:metallophosphoesterase family protein [Chloroflexota bacterium]